MSQKEEKIVAEIKAMEKERKIDFDAQNKVAELKWGKYLSKTTGDAFKIEYKKQVDAIFSGILIQCYCLLTTTFFLLCCCSSFICYLIFLEHI